MWALKIAAVSGFLSVALGAFGAHALKAKLSSDMLSVYNTAVEYQMFHTVALLVVGLLLRDMQSSLLNASAIAFTVGIILFSGSLYILAISGVKILGAITPIGGVAFLIAWALLFISFFKTA